eukprot:4732979-Prymnesium_polylepis.1
MQASKEAEAASLVQDAVRGAIPLEGDVAWAVNIAVGGQGCRVKITPAAGGAMDEAAAATSMQALQRGKAARADMQASKEAEAASLVQDA